SRARVIASYRRLAQRFAKIIADRPPMIVSGRMPGRGTRAFYRIRVPVQIIVVELFGGVCRHF
ncbi:MAG: hypothetical protein ACK2UP_00765, partial [Candidatus Promineifilaceae bacterium]